MTILKSMLPILVHLLRIFEKKGKKEEECRHWCIGADMGRCLFLEALRNLRQELLVNLQKYHNSQDSQELLDIRNLLVQVLVYCVATPTFGSYLVFTIQELPVYLVGTMLVGPMVLVSKYIQNIPLYQYQYIIIVPTIPGT